MPKPVGVIVFFDPDTQAVRVSVPFKQTPNRVELDLECPMREFTSGYNSRGCLPLPSPPEDVLSRYIGQLITSYSETFRLFRDAATSRDDRINKIRRDVVAGKSLSDENRELLIQVLDAQLATNRDSSGLDPSGDGHGRPSCSTPQAASPRTDGRKPAVG